MQQSGTTQAPLRLNIDLSYACNIRCTTCRCPDIDADTGAPLLPLQVAVRTIDEFAAMGGTVLSIYGGEPLLVPHVYDVVRHASARGLRVLMTTNAMAATVGNARRLLTDGLAKVTVSVDGDEAGHDLIRGKGTFAKTMRGASNFVDVAGALGKEKFRLSLHATVSRANVGHLAGLIRHAARLGRSVKVTVAYFSRLDDAATKATEEILERKSDPRRNHWRLPRELLLTENDLPVLEESLREMRRLAEEEGIGLSIDPALDAPANADPLLHGTFALRKPCPVFETALLLQPDGGIGSCPMLTHFSFGRVPDQSLASIWSSKVFDELRERMRDSYLPICQGCCRHADLM
jgi:radical SAM protein with 4Fe4S-binding SPASM domain